MLELRVERIVRELPDAATFYLAERNGKRIAYKAGQFLTLIFNHHQEEIRRSYSLSSSPDEPLLAITVKRVANGEISRFLLSKVNVGDIIYSADPAGVFTVDNRAGEADVVFFAAGSGITPVFALLKYLLNHPGTGKLHLIYSNRSRRDVLFYDELNRLQSEYALRLDITYLISDEGRRMSNAVVERLVNQQLAGDKQKALFYLCGPFSYMRTIRLTLHYMGIPDRNIRKENFVLETVPVTGSQTVYPPQKIRIHIGGKVHDVMAGENQSILQAALQNKVMLPYSCRSGICSACVAFCKTGKVEMVKNEVLANEDIANGLILTCTGHALTDDVEIAYSLTTR
ncbi:MAG TPA: ferredoxin--NADP reductase [Bacteroidetes bacterium]|nr:ferredoxin--NADP reductase [Bacteroidota bacterium]